MAETPPVTTPPTTVPERVFAHRPEHLSIARTMVAIFATGIAAAAVLLAIAWARGGWWWAAFAGVAWVLFAGMREEARSARALLRSHRQGPFAADDEGIWRAAAGKERGLVRWDRVAWVGYGDGGTRDLLDAERRVLISLPGGDQLSDWDELIELLAERTPSRGAAPPPLPRPTSRVTIALWVAAALGLLAGAAVYWGFGPLGRVALGLLAIAAYLALIAWPIAWLATRLFGHTRLTDAIMFLVLVGPLAWMALSGYADYRERKQAQRNLAGIAPGVLEHSAGEAKPLPLVLQALARSYPSLRIVADGPSNSPAEIGVATAGGALRWVAYGAGRCFAMRVVAGGEPLHALRSDEPGRCTASSFADAAFRLPEKPR